MDFRAIRPIHAKLRTLLQPLRYVGKLKVIFIVVLTVGGMIMWRHEVLSPPVRETGGRSFTGSPVRPVRQAMSFQYDNQSLPIKVKATTFKNLNLPPKTFRKLTPDNVKEFAIVTGCDTIHFRESMDAVASIQRHFPNRTVYYYDLGLTDAQRRQVQSWCNVQLRSWQAKKYPPHAATLHTYAFKPMVIREVLQEHGAALWIDASIRIRSDDWSQVYARVQETGGMFGMVNFGIPNFATTHPDVYNYFPLNVNLTRGIRAAGTGALLIYNTEEIYWGILHWWYLCALDPKCIAPTRQLRCNESFHASRSGPAHAVTWAKCHRFDQSIVNVLLMMHFGSGYSYLATTKELTPIDVIRKVSFIYKIHVC